MRPAHLHFKVEAPGYRTLITHIFVAGDPYLDRDAVFGVKESLITDFAEHPPGPGPDGRPLDGPVDQRGVRHRPRPPGAAAARVTGTWARSRPVSRNYRGGTGYQGPADGGGDAGRTRTNQQAGRRGGMAVRHAMLVITRAVFDMVEIPGQEPLVVAKDTGDEAARRWWDERVRAVAAGVFERNSDALGS